MVNSLYNFLDVEAKNPPKRTLRDDIKSVLRADNAACYVDMEPYLIDPGVSGSKFYDQAYAVDVLLKHDAKGAGRIANAMAETPTLRQRGLWIQLAKVLEETGFDLKRGRLVGLLEHKQPEQTTNESRQVEVH